MTTAPVSVSRRVSSKRAAIAAAGLLLAATAGFGGGSVLQGSAAERKPSLAPSLGTAAAGGVPTAEALAPLPVLRLRESKAPAPSSAVAEPPPRQFGKEVVGVQPSGGAGPSGQPGSGGETVHKESGGG